MLELLDTGILIEERLNPLFFRMDEESTKVPLYYTDVMKFVESFKESPLFRPYDTESRINSYKNL